MSFIGKWLLKIVDNARNNEIKGSACDCVPETARGDGNFGRPLNITVYNAHGGKIVTFRSYDRHKDRSNEATYIIHPDEEFSESLGKLIAMEEIKHV